MDVVAHNLTLDQDAARFRGNLDDDLLEPPINAVDQESAPIASQTRPVSSTGNSPLSLRGSPLVAASWRSADHSHERGVSTTS
jgi:hypothetical protein